MHLVGWYFQQLFAFFETFRRGMALAVDQKEELRLRMADLEKKLSESEDERRKLEKTCNVLIKAFKEEEKMRYKALNKKYEKFLEDCTVRKRRNDIILRSLCRIEDRSKVLFAKTERLKLLKDRYVSYLRVSNGNEGSQPRKTNAITPGLIQWRSPLVTYHNREEPKDLFSARGVPQFEVTNHPRREEVEQHEGRTTERTGFGYRSHAEDFPRADGNGDNSNFDDSNLRLRDRMTNALLQQMRNDELGGSCQIKEENYVSEMLNKRQDASGIGSMKGSVIGHDDSVEKLKSFMSEEALDNKNCDARHDPYDIVEKDHIEQSEKENKSLDELIPIMNHSLTVYSPTKGSHEEEKHQIDRESKEIAIKPESPVEEEESSLPKGLDGVDYENETYPESYYEQPAHHNHASIASDVILEEDESEQEEADCFERSSGRSPEQKATGKVTNDDSYKGQEWDSEKIGKTEGSDRAGKSSKSNLIHLLESDTESFQIEHGDAVSGNDDSDFEF